MNKVILIYDESPERLRIMSLCVNDHELSHLCQCHGVHITSDLFDGPADWLLKFMEQLKTDPEKHECEILFDNAQDDEQKPIEYYVNEDETFTIIVTGQIP